MCTVTWFHEGESYRLFCNRDELRTRKGALPPARHRRDGIAYLAPVDGEAGGSWISANERGLSLCLLNDYRSPAPEVGGGFSSRGLLVTSLASATDLKGLASAWEATDLRAYRPFRLLALAPGHRSRLLGWNGQQRGLRIEPVEQPLSSSSFDDEDAAATRRRHFCRLTAGAACAADELLLDFHRSHWPRRGPLSVCMHRPDAATVSLTRVEVDHDRVAMCYAGGPPCSTALAPPLSLPCRVATA